VVVHNSTTLLLGLVGLVVEQVIVQADGPLLVQVATADGVTAVCPGCAVRSSSPKEWRTMHPWDWELGGKVRLSWRKRRWRCRNPTCERGSFTESVPAVPARSRLTARLRQHAGAAVADHGRTVVQAARDLDLSWPTVHRALATHAGRVLAAEPAPAMVLGIDETRRGRRRFTAPTPSVGCKQQNYERR
jgi:transposase